jgi:hypothetical protein
MKKNIQAYSMLEASFIIIIATILFVGVYEGFNIYRETMISRSQSLTQGSIIYRIPSLLTWFESSMPNSFNNKEREEDKAITLWFDKSSNKIQKFDAYGAQNSVNKKFNYEANAQLNTSGPTFVEDGLNNLPSLKFSNSSTKSQFLVIDPSLQITSNNFSIFMVVNFRKTNSEAIILDRVCIKNNMEITNQENDAIEGCKSKISLKINNLNKLEFAITNSLNQTVELISQDSIDKKTGHLIALERNYNNSLNLYIDGKLSQTLSENLGNLYPFPIKIGRHASIENLDYQFELSELIILEDILNQKSRQELENYFAKKYAINMNR